MSSFEFADCGSSGAKPGGMFELLRWRQLKRLWARLKQLSTMQLTREELLMKRGAARDQSRTAWRLIARSLATRSRLWAKTLASLHH